MSKQKTLAIFLLFALVALSVSGVIAQERVQVRWYVGLGAGTDAPLVAAQQAIVDDFNASQDEIELVLEIVDNNQAYDVLSTQIAAGNAPDIVGPMGIRGRASFPNAWLDLSELIESTSYDLTDFDPALVEFYNIENEGQVGIPFAVFPSTFLYNKALFDEAGIPYPPSTYGEPYIDWDGNERPWDMETVTEIAKILTVDVHGNDGLSGELDTENIVQFGFGNQFTDVRGRDTLFGAGNFVDEEGNAVIPAEWLAAEQWYHQGMWQDYFYPNGVYGNSDILGGAGGNWFGSGNIGMINIHLWFVGWGTVDLGGEWDFAPVASYNDVITAKLHADSFSIMKASRNQEAAFTVLTYLLGERAEDLTSLYGGMPARLSLQDTYFDNYTAQMTESYPETDWANINWDVATASLSYPDNPNHEEAMPNFLEASARYAEYSQLIDNDPNADVEAELEKLRVDLQAIFDRGQ